MLENLCFENFLSQNHCDLIEWYIENLGTQMAVFPFDTEPLSEEKFGPVRKYFLDSSLHRGGLAAYLDIFSG